MFLSVSYSPDWAPLQSEHAPVPAEAAAAAVAVPMQLSKAFRVEASMAGLHQLLNATVTVAVHDAVSGVVLATAPLDLLPLARGKQAFSLQHVQLTCAKPSPKSIMQVCAACRMAALHRTALTATLRSPRASQHSHSCSQWVLELRTKKELQLRPLCSAPGTFTQSYSMLPLFRL